MTSIPSSELADRLATLLPRVAKPARYVGGELNQIVKPSGPGLRRMAVAFPDVYEVGMSNLAISILYDAVNSLPGWAAERVFCPWLDMETEMRAAGLPLFTLETKTPLARCSVLGIALANELCYTNVLNMLDLAGIPLRSEQRADGDWPLVLGGGHCTFNPEPMAPFFDAFVIGEAEPVLPAVLAAVEAHEGSRSDLLAALAAVPGVYVPSLYAPVDGKRVRPIQPGVPRRVKRQLVPDVAGLRYPTEPVVPYIEAVHDRIAIEVMRGCTRGCRFCQAGMVTRPVRERPVDEVLQIARRMVATTGHDDISLVSLSTADHSGVEAMVGELLREHGGRRIGVSLPSLRADRDCVKLAADIQSVRKTGLTFAPEAGTQRLRDVINKNVTEADLMSVAEAAFSSGWRRLKLYFMISLPTETDEDVVAIPALASRVANVARRMGVRNITIGVGVSPFVPKPHTPFQWCAQDPLAEIERKTKLLRDSCRDKAVQLRFNRSAPSQLEGVLARGDRSVAEAIEGAWRAGAKYDAWDEGFSHSRWLAAFEAAGVSVHQTAERRRTLAEALPWDHIDCGVSKAYLKSEWRRAQAAQLTEDCHFGPCTLCAACERFLPAARVAAAQTLAD